MRNGVNCLSTLIRSVVRCLNVVFTCFVEKNILGVFCIRVIFIFLLLSVTSMSSSLWIWQEKKIRVFCHRDILKNGHSTKSINRFFPGGVFCYRDIFKQGDFIHPNRLIAFFQGSFWFKVFWGRIVLYVLINQQQKTKGCFDLGYLDPGG